MQMAPKPSLADADAGEGIDGRALDACMNGWTVGLAAERRQRAPMQSATKLARRNDAAKQAPIPTLANVELRSG